MFIVYKTTNKVNGKYYIGKHKTLNPNDSYLGTGTLIQQAINKYGKESFVKEILFTFDSEAECFAKEQELVTEAQANDSNCYNLRTGGEGGRSHHESTKQHLRELNTGKPQSEEAKEKNRASNLGRVWTEEAKQSLRKPKHSGHGEKVRQANLGRKMSAATKRKISESLKKRNSK